MKTKVSSLASIITLVIIIWIGISIVRSSYTYFWREIDVTKTDIPQDIWVNTHSGELLPIINNSGSHEQIYVRPLDEFFSINGKDNYTNFNPDQQPPLNSDYSNNTERMLEYLKNNAFDVRIQSPFKRGFLYYKIHDPKRLAIQKGDKLFLYLHNNKESWYIDLSTPLDYRISKSWDIELLFDLKHLRLIPWKSSSTQISAVDFATKLSYFSVSNYIGSFYINTRGATIEEVAVAYE